ncbi:hypothetical protein BC834DRAFT_891703, partial [Gloeopeniophorella convolvens]
NAILGSDSTAVVPSSSFLADLCCSTCAYLQGAVGLLSTHASTLLDFLVLEDEIVNGVCLKGGGCLHFWRRERTFFCVDCWEGSCVADLEDRGDHNDDECERGKLHVYDNKGGVGAAVLWRDVLVLFNHRLERHRVPLYSSYMAHPVKVPGSCTSGVHLPNPERVASHSPGRRPPARRGSGVACATAGRSCPWAVLRCESPAGGAQFASTPLHVYVHQDRLSRHSCSTAAVWQRENS